MLSVKITKEVGLKLAELFVTTGFYRQWDNFRPPLTVEKQFKDLSASVEEENETIFILHYDGGFMWRTVGDNGFCSLDNTDNGGPFNEAQTQTIKEFLLANGEVMELKGWDLLYTA